MLNTFQDCVPIFAQLNRCPLEYLMQVVIICAAIAIFVATRTCCRRQLEIHSNSIRTKRANGVAVFEGNPNRYNKELLYRIGLPSNTATPLALFGGCLRIELDSKSFRTNRAIMMNGRLILEYDMFSSMQLHWCCFSH